MAGNIMTRNDDIARTLLRILCSQPSCKTDIQTLKRELRRYDIRQHINLDIFLDDYSNHFMVVDGIVTAFTTLEICPHHCQKKGQCEQEYCNKLHVCKFFLLSQCTYERIGVCQFGHDLDSPHNRPLIKGHLLDGLNVPLIQRLFKSGQSRTSLTMPLVCKFYNHKRGCTRRIFCPHLHICHFYVEGSCKFGTGCHRNHDINNPQVLKVLNRFGIDMQRRPKDILQDLRLSLSRESRGDNMMRYSSMPSLSMSGLSSQAMPLGRHRPSRVQRMSEGPGSSPMGGPEEICKYHLRGGKGCSFGSSCFSLHLDTPYQWQHREGPGTDWLDFEDFTNKTIERSFRDVDSSECTVCFDDSDESDSDSDSEEDHGKEQGEIIVDFHTMKALGQGRQLEVRRLGTASTLSVHPQIARSFRQHLTGWIWYWFDDVTKQWIEYGQKGQDGKSSSVDSSDIEKAFLSDQGQVQFLVGLASFKIKFSTMTQKNLITRKKKVVRRRPEPIY